MDKEERLEKALVDAANNGTVPGSVLSLGRVDRLPRRFIAGHAQAFGGKTRAMGYDLLFDLASLTKVVSTVPSVLALAETGQLCLEDPVAKFVPSFAGGLRDEVDVRALLTHTSGLPASERLYRRGLRDYELIDAVCNTELVAPPGSQVLYSDLGYILLGEVVSNSSGLSLRNYTLSSLFAPIGMHSAAWGPGLAPDKCVATEVWDDGSACVGQVHDRNAAALGGAAGHAGLFATISDLECFASFWLGLRESPIRRAARERALVPVTSVPGGHRALGWVCPGDPANFLGPGWPPRTVSHTGFTGTSIVMVPETSSWCILLTNALHAGRNKEIVRDFRRQVHDVAYQVLVNV